MTETTDPAGELRAAAALLREAASHATPGPWRTHDTHLGSTGGHTATVLTDRPNINDTELVAWLPTMSNEPWDEARNAWRNAGWMALLHPGVGLALAAWLESWTGVDLTEHGPMPEDARHALAVARQVLGTTTGQPENETRGVTEPDTGLRARFEALAADWEQRGEYGDVSLTWGARAIRATLTDSAVPVDRTPVCICGHPAQQHFEDVCQVCDCGDYLEPAEARVVIARWREAALGVRDGRRATTLREGADLIEQALIHSVTPAASKRDEVWDQAVRAAAAELRDVADGLSAEAQQPTPAVAAPFFVCDTDNMQMGEPPTPAPAEEGLTDSERQFLAYALHLADEQMASRGDEFVDSDRAALVKLQRLAKAGCTCGNVNEAWIETPHTADCAAVPAP